MVFELLYLANSPQIMIESTIKTPDKHILEAGCIEIILLQNELMRYQGN
jgi:hypothetical protein